MGIGANTVYRRKPNGLTLIEVMIAMFIFLVGIVGVLAAMPTGVNSALWVIFQDSAIHLSHSKFAEFRRDRIDPAVDLVPTANGYLPTNTAYVPGNQEPYNTGTGDGDPWRDFAHNPAGTGGVPDPYQYFEDIDRYEWKVETSPVDNGPGAAGDVQAAPGFYFPADAKANPTLNLMKVSITIRAKGTTRQMRFSQLMMAYGKL
jgi:prepilin-type N-terminal cleavage/methylation domain-containing protein